MYRILMVDDDLKNLQATKMFLTGKGYDVATTSAPSEAIELAKEHEFALTLMDYKMPEMLGSDLAVMIRKINPNQQIAMYSCDLSREALKDSLRAGAIDFIEKILSPDKLLALVESYCNKYEANFRTIRSSKDKSESRRLIEEAGMVGQSRSLVETVTTVKKIASAPDTSVLVRGESGTGKELVAQAIHNLSSRSRGPFVAINCGAIPRDLLESELFGHVKGAFTGASADQVGKFALANGGTIFLDEIGDMPLELQVKILRVLQEREIVPVGGKFPKKVDVRVITATHRKIEDLVAKGLFREDLMYRIKVVDVEIEPLRNRTEDIEPLVAHFTERFNKKHGTKKFFQRRTLEVLKKYSWPGNVRELQTTVEKHLVVCSENMIRPDDLDPKLYEATPSAMRGRTFEQYRNMRQEEELKFLQCTIEDAGGNKAEAARRLAISANHLQHLLRQ